MQLYAIGDIHGHLDLLRGAHAKIASDKARTGNERAPVVHIGDYCDRGPDTRGVLDYLIDGVNGSEPWQCLLGNHDRMMRRFLMPERLRDPLRDDLFWLQDNLGGRTTLESYGIDASVDRDRAFIHRDALDAVPQKHIDFLDRLATAYWLEDVFLCHAGVRPGVPLQDQIEDDLVWIRQEFLNDDRDHGALIVHGHTPAKTLEHKGNRVNIDTAAAYGGPLSVVVIEGRDVWELTHEGRIPLHLQAHDLI